MTARLAALLLATTLALPARADGPTRLVVTIRGMVCSFCAQGLERLFRAEKAVRAVRVSLGTKTVRLELAPDAVLEEARVKVLVEDAGFDFVRMEREAAE
jgi:mercuric ion binding protein